jgi:hypothetical protein
MRWNHLMLELIPKPDLIDSESKKKKLWVGQYFKNGGPILYN